MMKKISIFRKIIGNEDLTEISSDLIEIGFDGLLDEGILKEIPIVSFITKIINLKSTISDKIFTNKLLNFLYHLKDIPIEQRIAVIERIEKNNISVGEKILYILDKSDDNEKANYIGILFKSFLNEELTYEDFLRASNCINSVYIQDLNYFISKEFDQLTHDEIDTLHPAGLFALDIEFTDYTMQSHSGPGEKNIKRIVFNATYIGKKIREILKKEKTTANKASIPLS